VLVWTKLALLTMLLAAYAVVAFAQEKASPTATPEQEPAAEERRGPDSRLASIRLINPVTTGWNVALGGSVLEIFDNNPKGSLSSASDTEQRFSGSLNLSHQTARSSYALSYSPSFTQYRRFSQLNALSQTLDQSVGYRLSKSNSIAWSVTAQAFPAGAGSAYAFNAIGALSSAQSGIAERDLMSDTTSAQTSMRFDHALSGRSNLEFVASGGLTKYHNQGQDSFPGLSFPRDSRTWDGGMSVGYRYTLAPRSSLSFNAAHQYFQFTTGNSHQHVESLNVSYSRQIKGHYSFGLSLGPGFSEQQGNRSVSPKLVLRVEAGRATSRTSVRAYLDRSYQPGLEAGSLTSWTGRVAYERIFSRRWSSGLYVSYQSSQNATAAANQRIPLSEAYTAGAQTDYRLQRRLRWILNYAYSQQKGYTIGNQRMSRTQVMTGFSVQFDRAIR